MKDGKATWPDYIPVEVWRSLEEEGLEWLCWLVNKTYEKEKIPDAAISSQYTKRKETYRTVKITEELNSCRIQ